jgi:hypothetical protein
MRSLSHRQLDKNCAVREFTADGICVGRCWAFVGEHGLCPRHGDVSEAQRKYRDTGRLTDDPRWSREKRA